MSLRHHLQLHIPKYEKRSIIFPIGMMIFFFVIFDGILMYLAPIIITKNGISESLMGIIIGSSSIAGMIFDLILCRILKNTNYRRIFLLMFILSILFPLFLFGGKTIFIYFIAMAVWGFYYDFYNIGTLDFVGRTADNEHDATSFGILRAFEGTGYLIAPLLGSILLLYIHPGPHMMLILGFPLLFSFLFYFIATHKQIVEKEEYSGVKLKVQHSFFKEIKLWKKLASMLFPILSLILLINLIDAAIWTFGPIFSEQIGKINNVPGGLFMIAYQLPPLLVGWVVGIITRKFGTKKTAQGAIIIGSIILIFVGFVTSIIPSIILIFLSSFFLAIGWPSIDAVYTEYINNIPTYSKEIETLQDLFTNFGDTAGPIIGGYMAQYLGFSHSFIVLGILGTVTVILLFLLKNKPNYIIEKI